MLAYYSKVFFGGTETLKKFVGRINEVELSVLAFRAFFRDVRFGPVKRMSFNRLIDWSHGQDIFIKVLSAVVKERFHSGILRMIGHMSVDSTLAFVVLDRLSKVDRDAFGSRDWFSHKYMTGKLSFVR